MRTSSLEVSSGATTCVLPVGGTSKGEPVKVIIVGAGLSGLVSDMLEEAGHEVVVLEAPKRLRAAPLPAVMTDRHGRAALASSVLIA